MQYSSWFNTMNYTVPPNNKIQSSYRWNQSLHSRNRNSLKGHKNSLWTLWEAVLSFLNAALLWMTFFSQLNRNGEYFKGTWHVLISHNLLASSNSFLSTNPPVNTWKGNCSFIWIIIQTSVPSNFQKCHVLWSFVKYITI